MTTNRGTVFICCFMTLMSILNTCTLLCIYVLRLWSEYVFIVSLRLVCNPTFARLVSSPVKGCLYYDTCAVYMCAAHVHRTCAMTVYTVAHVRHTCVTYRMFPTTYMYGRGLWTTPFCKVTSLVASFSCYRGYDI